MEQIFFIGFARCLSKSARNRLRRLEAKGMKYNVTMKSSYIAGEEAISKANGLIEATKKVQVPHSKNCC